MTREEAIKMVGDYMKEVPVSFLETYTFIHYLYKAGYTIEKRAA